MPADEDAENVLTWRAHAFETGEGVPHREAGVSGRITRKEKSAWNCGIVEGIIFLLAPKVPTSV